MDGMKRCGCLFVIATTIYLVNGGTRRARQASDVDLLHAAAAAAVWMWMWTLERMAASQLKELSPCDAHGVMVSDAACMW